MSSTRSSPRLIPCILWWGHPPNIHFLIRFQIAGDKGERPLYTVSLGVTPPPYTFQLVDLNRPLNTFNTDLDRPLNTELAPPLYSELDRPLNTF